MIQYIQDMIKKSTVALEDVVFIDFSYDNNKSIKLSEICAWFESRDKKPCFVLDEIQEVPEFDRQLVGIYNK
jgi:predicted AAA+ superfamily ATPase